MNQQEHKIKRFCMAVLAHVDAERRPCQRDFCIQGEVSVKLAE